MARKDLEEARAYDRAYSRAYHEAHREERRAYARAYNEVHQDEQRTHARAYRAMHREVRRAYLATRREDIAARRRTYDETHRKERYIWRKAHPQNITKQGRRRRAREHGAAIGLIDFAAIQIRDQMTCCICRRRVAEKDLSFDHSHPLSLGGAHSQENLRVAHLHCNKKRGAGHLPVQMILI